MPGAAVSLPGVWWFHGAVTQQPTPAPPDQPPTTGPTPVPLPHGPVPWRPLAVLPEAAAPRGRRVLAKLVDLLVIAVLVAAGTVPMMLLDRVAHPPVWATVVAVGLYVVVLLAALLLYDPLCEVRGGTVGKRLLGLRVVSLETGRPLRPATAVARHLLGGSLSFATLVPVTYLWFLWDRPYRQCLHDKLMRTVVVRRAGVAPAVPSPPAGAGPLG